MYKFYVTRGYPLPTLLESTWAERILLREAMNDWEDAFSDAEEGVKNGKNSNDSPYIKG